MQFGWSMRLLPLYQPRLKWEQLQFEVVGATVAVVPAADDV